MMSTLFPGDNAGVAMLSSTLGKISAPPTYPLFVFKHFVEFQHQAAVLQKDSLSFISKHPTTCNGLSNLEPVTGCQVWHVCHIVEHNIHDCAIIKLYHILFLSNFERFNILSVSNGDLLLDGLSIVHWNGPCDMKLHYLQCICSWSSTLSCCSCCCLHNSQHCQQQFLQFFHPK
jgi:hypothetical protein